MIVSYSSTEVIWRRISSGDDLERTDLVYFKVFGGWSEKDHEKRPQLSYYGSMY
jgi:hypothetical protein